jgi:cell division protein FtsB
MRIISPKIMLLVAGIIILLILFALAQEMNRRLQVQREIVQLDSEVSALEKNLIEMNNLNQYFKTDDFAELMAREKLNYKATGEKVVLIPEEQEGELIKEEETYEDTQSIPKKWWDAFFTKPLQLGSL